MRSVRAAAAEMILRIQDIPIAFRPMEPTDVGFIVSTWLRSEASLLSMRKDWCEAWRRPVINQHVLRDRVTIACSAEVPRTIYGWICHAGQAILYAYVAHGMQGHGLGRALMREVKEPHAHQAAER